MLSLLKSVETISSCRDRGRLPCAFSRAVVSLLGESADVGIFVRGAPGDVVLRMVCGETLAHAEQSGWRDFIEEARVDGGVKIRTICAQPTQMARQFPVIMRLSARRTPAF